MRINILFLLIILFSPACQEQQKIDVEAERNKILKLHPLQRDYHFNKDSTAFVNQLSSNFISVNKGEITHPSKEETLSRYHSYFSAVEFVEWDDVTPPIIHFSEDGTLAYSVVDKIVKVTYQGEKGEIIEDETHFAWTAIYRKYGEEWKIDCVTSTNKPLKSD